MSNTAIPSVSAEEIAWIRQLCEQIWKEMSPDHFGRTTVWPERELTEAEWERLRAIIANHHLPVEMRETQGHLYLRVYTHPEILGLPAELLFCIQADHLPGIRQNHRGYEKSFPYSWEQFKPIVDTPRNTELLELYGLEKLREKQYYIY